MKENELRLNNLVMVNYKTDILAIVTWIQEGSINVVFDRQPDLINGAVCSVNDLKPIRLTEEWLLKGGAEKKKSHWGYDRFTLLYSKDYNFFSVRDAETLAYITKVEFVHEWQNLVFILNGTEIIFK